MRDEFRENPNILDEYWNDLRNGRIPEKFQIMLRKEGEDFAIKLKQNKEFRDFAKDLTHRSMEILLKNLRADLRAQYQKRMIDILPQLASIAVDSAFDENVKDVDQWAKKSLENLKPLLLSAEAIDTESNLMLIIRAEINRRIQQRLSV